MADISIGTPTISRGLTVTVNAYRVNNGTELSPAMQGAYGYATIALGVATALLTIEKEETPGETSTEVDIYARYYASAGMPGTPDVEVLLKHYVYVDTDTEEYDLEAVCSIDLSLACDLRLAYSGARSVGASDDEIWRGFIGYDPYGPALNTSDHYYVPIGDVDIEVNLEGETYFYSETADELAFQYGWPAVGGYINSGEFDHSYYLGVNDGVQIGSITVTGHPGDAPSGTAAYRREYNEFGVYFQMDATLVDGTLTVISNGMNHEAYDMARYTIEVGPHDIVYDGTVQHLDGTAPETIHLIASEYDESETQLTGDSSGTAATLTQHYAGTWQAGFVTDIEYDEWTDNISHGGRERTHSIQCEDLMDSGEPDFYSGPVDLTEHGQNYAEFLDSSITLDCICAETESAMTITAPMSAEAFTFDDATGWTVTPPASATFAVVDDEVVVTVTDDCSISRTIDATFKGVRYGQLEYESDDTTAKTVTLGDREYSVTPSTVRFDLLAPTNESGIDTTQTAWAVTAPTWGWGLWGVDSFALAGLKSSNTYTLKRLNRVRRTGGTLQCILNDGAFVGAIPADSREGDAYSLYSKLVDTTTYYYSRRGFVLVDGVVALELMDMEHVRSGGIGYWSHNPVDITDYTKSLVPAPDDNHVTVTGMEDLELVFLTDAAHSTTGETLTIPWKPRSTELKLPAEMNQNTIPFTKQFRGRGFVRAISGAVKIEKYQRDGGALVSTVSPSVDLDRVWKPASDTQPIMLPIRVESFDAGEWTLTGDPGIDLVGHTIYWADGDRDPQTGTVLTHTDDVLTIDNATDPPTDSDVYVLMPYSYDIVAGTGGDETTETVQLRNRGWIFATVKLPDNATECDLYIDDLTGVGMLAYIEGSSLMMAPTYDAGATFGAGVEVSNSSPTSPCVLLGMDALHSWGVSYNEAGATKIAWSTDGFATKEVATLMTGCTNVKVRIHPLTGVMLIAGWDTTAEEIVCAQSFDSGVTVSTPDTVVVTTEQAFGLDSAPTALGTWCITYSDAGTIKTMWSTDNGLTWSAAA